MEHDITTNPASERIWKDLEDAVSVARGVLDDALWAEIDLAAGTARENADETVYVEKSEPVENWARCAMMSLECLLCAMDHDAFARCWFKDYGVNF